MAWSSHPHLAVRTSQKPHAQKPVLRNLRAGVLLLGPGQSDFLSLKLTERDPSMKSPQEVAVWCRFSSWVEERDFSNWAQTHLDSRQVEHVHAWASRSLHSHWTESIVNIPSGSRPSSGRSSRWTPKGSRSTKKSSKARNDSGLSKSSNGAVSSKSSSGSSKRSTSVSASSKRPTSGRQSKDSQVKHQGGSSQPNSGGIPSKSMDGGSMKQSSGGRTSSTSDTTSTSGSGGSSSSSGGTRPATVRSKI